MLPGEKDFRSTRPHFELHAGFAARILPPSGPISRGEVQQTVESPFAGDANMRIKLAKGPEREKSNNARGFARRMIQEIA